MSNVISIFDSVVVPSAVVVPSNDVVNPAPVVFRNYAGKEQTMFNVEKQPIFSPYGVIDGKNGLFVNEQCINIVSDHYEIVQPNDVYQRFAMLADQTNLKINKVLLNPQNGGLMISALFEHTRINGDSHDVNVVFYTSHCGKYKTFLTLDVLRIACFNQVPALYQNKDRFIFAEKHYKNALDLDLMTEALDNIPASVEAYNIRAQRLQDVKLSKADFIDWYANQLKLKKEQKQYDSKISNIKALYSSATGQTQLADGTGWKAFNAITYANTHNGKQTAYKAENALLKGGDNSLKLLDELLAIA